MFIGTSIGLNQLVDFLKTIKKEDSWNFTHCEFIDPIYWAIFKALKINGKDVKVYVRKDSPAYAYCEYVAGKSSSKTTIPLKVVKNRGEVDRFTQDLVELLKRHITIQQQIDEDDWEFLKYQISELLNNALDHSKWYKAVVCTQYFPRIDEIEIAVVDCGIGFYNTIQRRYNVKNEIEAVQKALEKGVSGAQVIPYGSAYKNVGYGLYVISKMIKDSQGELIIISNDSFYKYPQNQYLKGLQWEGAIILIRFNLSQFKKNVMDLGFNVYLNMIIEAEETEEIF